MHAALTSSRALWYNMYRTTEQGFHMYRLAKQQSQWNKAHSATHRAFLETISLGPLFSLCRPPHPLCDSKT